MDIQSFMESYSYFNDFGFCLLEKPLSLSFYKDWIQNDYHGEMAYLKNHLIQKENPQHLMKEALSAIVVTKNYFPHPEKQEGNPLKSSKNIALYARGKDYHHWFQEEINKLCAQLKDKYPEESFLGFTDSHPVLERDLAYKAGLGWFGKNTCIIHEKKGSLFFIGEIYTSLELKSFRALHPDRCGTCTKCIDACPTNAFTKDRVLDARKCISYLTIESKTNPELDLRKKMGDWLFGCDICQTVCPWNEKVFGFSKLSKKTESSELNESLQLLEDLKWILECSNKQIQKSLVSSPLARAGGNGLKRNAMIISVNRGFSELIPLIKNYSDHEKLGELARWSTKELSLL